MEIVRRALLDLRRQPKLLAVYALAHFLLILVFRAGERLLGMGIDPAAAPEWYPAFNLGKQFAMAPSSRPSRPSFSRASARPLTAPSGNATPTKKPCNASSSSGLSSTSLESRPSNSW
ncbi:MAG: hypothetical protein HC888_18505 [Candidatus Competibacteraceae bacterium]|nr:hypothetical protein [Candidatus Competibacteraceae bacterium]